jgi:hypothetical protein
MWLGEAKTSCSSPLSSSEPSEREERVEPPVCRAPGAPIARNLSIMLAVWSLSASAESTQKVPLRRARAVSCAVRLW